MSTRKRLLNLCCGCTAPKLSSVFSPKPQHHHHHTPMINQQYCSNYSSSSPFMAVERESEDPYLDFRASMVQMIVENQIYSKEELRYLLTCFLQLNSPCVHGVIISAFNEIWNTLLFSSTTTTTAPTKHCRRRRRRPSRQYMC